jgi:hypothetical protein
MGVTADCRPGTMLPAFSAPAFFTKSDTAGRCHWEMKMGDRRYPALVPPSGQRSGEDGATSPLNKVTPSVPGHY